MNDERDELIERAARALQAMPPVKAGAVARVLMAVRANQARPRPAWRRVLAEWRESSVSVRAAAMLAAASLVIGFFVRGGVDTPMVAAGSPVETALQPASNASGEIHGVPMALAFQAANAKTVSVVGDFNGWDPAATPMRRVGTDGPWETTVLAKPGRHVYAYLVDGTTLVADPLAPKARSADFGGDASVMMVRTP